MALKIKKIEYHKAKKLPPLPLPLKHHNLPMIKTQYNANNNSVLNEVHLECLHDSLKLNILKFLRGEFHIHKSINYTITQYKN